MTSLAYNLEPLVTYEEIQDDLAHRFNSEQERRGIHQTFGNSSVKALKVLLPQAVLQHLKVQLLRDLEIFEEDCKICRVIYLDFDWSCLQSKHSSSTRIIKWKFICCSSSISY